MSIQYKFVMLSSITALIFAPIAIAQVPESGPSQPGDLELGCSSLALEMSKSAQLLGSPQSVPTETAKIGSGGIAGALGSAVGTSGLEAVGKAYQQQQNAQQLGNLQVLAARGGISPGTAGAAIGGLAALQQVAGNGGNVQDAARSVIADRASAELASRIPGGALIGGLMGGFMKKKPKPVALAAAAPLITSASSSAQARLMFLSGLVGARGCK